MAEQEGREEQQTAVRQSFSLADQSSREPGAPEAAPPYQKPYLTPPETSGDTGFSPAKSAYSPTRHASSPFGGRPGIRAKMYDTPPDSTAGSVSGLSLASSSFLNAGTPGRAGVQDRPSPLSSPSRWQHDTAASLDEGQQLIGDMHRASEITLRNEAQPVQGHSEATYEPSMGAASQATVQEHRQEEAQAEADGSPAHPTGKLAGPVVPRLDIPSPPKLPMPAQALPGQLEDHSLNLAAPPAANQAQPRTAAAHEVQSSTYAEDELLRQLESAIAGRDDSTTDRSLATAEASVDDLGTQGSTMSEQAGTPPARNAEAETLQRAPPMSHQQPAGPATPYAELLPPAIAVVPEMAESADLSLQFAAASRQLQSDMSDLKRSLENLDIGGVDGVPVAAGLLGRSTQYAADSPFSHAPDPAFQLFPPPSPPEPRHAGQSDGDLAAFLTGLRGKYGMTSTSRQRGSVEVAETSLQRLPTSPVRQPPQQAQQQQTEAAASPATTAGQHADWQALNQLLRDNGFSGMPLPQPGQDGQPGGPPASAALPLEALHAAFVGVLRQYDRWAHLVQELLTATDLAREREARVDASMKRLRQERDKALKEASESATRTKRDVGEARKHQAKVAATAKRLETEVQQLRQQVGLLEQAKRSHHKQLAGLAGTVSVVDKRKEEAERAAERVREGKARRDAEVQRLQHIVAELDQAKRAKERELEGLSETASQSERGREEAERAAEQASEAAKRLEAEIQRLQRYIAQLESANRVKERELQHLRKSASLADRQSESSSTAAERAREDARRLEAELHHLQARLARLQQDTRAKEEELSQVAASASLSERERAKAERAAQDTAQRLQSEVQRLQAQLTQMEQATRSKEQEIQEWMETASVSSRGVDAAEKEAQKARESAQRLESEVQRLNKQLGDLEHSYRVRDNEVQQWMETASQSDRGLDEAEQRASQKMEGEVGRLRQHLAQAEHGGRAKEAVLQKLRARLTDKVAQDERRGKRDADALARIKRAIITHKGDPQGRAAAGAVSAAARELRPVEIVSMYESHREGMEMELVALRAEVRTLADQLRQAENALSAKARNGPWKSPQEGEAVTRVMEAEKAAAEAQRALTSAQSAAAEAARLASRHVAQAEHRADVLAEENASLILELDARPTVKQYKSLQRQLEILELRAAQAKPGGQTAGDTAADGELDLGIKVLGGEALTSRERMRRDKELHRLGLACVERIPRDVLVDLVQDLCIALELADPTALPAAAHKLLRAVASLPRLERFVGEVCEAVFRRGHAFIPAAHANEDPSAVPAVIAAWLSQLAELRQAQEIQQAVVRLLQARVGAVEGQPPPQAASEMVAQVRHLVDQERHSLQAADTIAAAKDLLQAQPEVLLHRIVAHFQHLFDCRQLDGVLPAMNQVFVSYTEGRNFKRALSSLLGLPQDASLPACLQRIRHLLDRQGAALDLKSDYMAGSHQGASQADLSRPAGRDNWPTVEIRAPGEAPSTIAGGAPHQQKQAAGSPRRPAGHAASPAAAGPSTGLHDAMADPKIKLHVDITQGLMKLLRVSSPDQVVKQVEKLVERLRRLDEVMPKYQHVCSQLYDLLRVRALDELVPSVRRLISRN
ncbi:hypothetical protein WJX72_007055 [[Myrmecia] bisecta]|uniref:Centrosomal protein of 70 kDa n=1 Tax=[Myrmecia] bisecta TaxID=41462 RepID=A0AAW1QFG7_9CHLO